MRVKPGFKAWSLLASLGFSLVVWTGCNTEEPAANPGATPGAAPVTKPAATTPPAPTTAKPEEGKKTP